MRKNILILSISFLAIFAMAEDDGSLLKVDPNLPEYQAASGVSGSIKSIGSDTMSNLMSHWLDGFHNHYPSVSTEIESKGSSTAIPALINGGATFGPMSRNVKPKESDEFEKKFGYQITQTPVCLDVVTVFVNKDNPLKGLSLDQLDAIFSKNRNSGYPKEIRVWGDVGLEGEWADRPITIYGRNAASGTYGFFKSYALAGGDYKDQVIEEPGSSSAIQGISRDRYGIGYCGIGYRTRDVHPIALKFSADSELVEPTAENAYTGEYPLTRFLWLSFNLAPGRALDPLRREFINYVYSREGQSDVIKAGFFPLPSNLIEKNKTILGIE
ncbi:phosphate ABC transporter substrate-binding protein [bacterium]|nr:phosphate ABC transporter substrate-binding protein [bacterium]